MIVRLLEHCALYDQQALAAEHDLSVRTVRRRCHPVACDLQTRAPLYDADACSEVLGKVRPRPARAAGEQRLRRLGFA